MGAINYGSSDIVNIGLNIDSCFYDNADAEDRENELEFMRDYIQETLDEFYFDFVKIEISSGYYEGFYINIEDPGFNYFDNYIEKQEYIKELSQVHRMLKECINKGLVEYSPGWCTGYSTEKESYIDLAAAIKTAKQAARTTPTYKNYQYCMEG